MRRNGPAVIGQLPCAPGVYRFRDALGRVLYVGRATTLRSRVARTGRTCVCRWSQRACSVPGAAGALAVTPHAWGDFMQRTAELAAKMAGLGPCPPSLPLASLGLLAWYAGLPARRLLSEPSQRGFVNVRGLIVLSGNS